MRNMLVPFSHESKAFAHPIWKEAAAMLWLGQNKQPAAPAAVGNTRAIESRRPQWPRRIRPVGRAELRENVRTHSG